MKGQRSQSKTQKPPIRINSNDRILIVGAPKDGKTTLALALLQAIKPKKLVILNPGAEEKFYQLFGDSRPTIDKSFPQVQHVAPYFKEDKKKYGPIWWPIINEGCVFTFIDELAAVSSASQYSPGLMYLYQMGRRRFCGVIAVTQRAKNIPVLAFSFSEHIFVGYCTGPDLERLEKDTGRKWGHLIEQRGPNQFLYWNRLENNEPYFIN